MSHHVIYLILILANLNTIWPLNDEWNYKFSFTKQINSQVTIDCGQQEAQIWIGWSHYGTRNIIAQSKKVNQEVLNFPSENDCWMNFTEKIAEQCNGSPQCELSSQPTYIHKCGKISDYLYVSYKCVKEIDTFDICGSMTRTFESGQSVYIKSSDFPTEYAASLDCSCSIVSTMANTLKMEVMWFSLQDNDFLNVLNKNVSGWLNPTSEWPLVSTQNTIRFMTDDALAYKGFWLKLSPRKQCKKDWQLVGDNCVKVFSDTMDWRSANKRCQQMNGHLLKIDDVVHDLKLTQYMKSYYPEVNSYWIGLRKYLDETNREKWMWSNNLTTTTTTYEDVSWWPWKDVSGGASVASTSAYAQIVSTTSSYQVNNCVVKHKNEDGYFTTSCDPANKNSFICQTQAIYPTLSNNEINLKCGPSDEVNKLLNKNVETINSIGVNSIKNTMMPQLFTTTTIKSTSMPLLSVDTEQIRKIDADTGEQQEMLFNLQTAKITQLFTEFKKLSTKLSSSSSPFLETTTQSAQTPSHLINTDLKFNTTILAGIISGIGLVIVVINLVVLFLCRRNLKNFLKSSSHSSSSSSTSSSASSSSSLSLSKNLKIHRDDLIQEYFEAFNTMHAPVVVHNKKSLKLMETGGGGNNQNLPIALMNTIHRLQQQQQQQSTSGDESAKLFYNHSDLLTQTMRNTDQDNILKRQLLQHLQQQQQHNQDMHQYDKMNHQAIHKEEEASSNETGPNQQHYAHTYECLDSLEMINSNNNINNNNNKRPTGIHLGVSSRTSQRAYRTNLNNSSNHNKSNNNSIINANGEMVNSFNDTNTQNTTNLTDIANFNISSSSTSSSSGVSSTHQFISNNKNNNNNNSKALHFLQQQSPNSFLLNSTANLNAKFLQNSQNIKSQQYLQFNGDLINVSNIGANGSGGTWSPDSAYYSAIPTLNNYNYNLPQQQQQQTQFNSQQLQQFVNNHHNVSNSLVDAGYNSQLV